MNKDEKLTVIVGLGKTGLSCMRYLTKHGVNVVGVDSRAKPPNLQEIKKDFPNTTLYLGGFHQEILDKADEIVLSPGVSLREPEIFAQKKRNVPIIGDIELFAREAKAPIIAITGSNGKSTVTAMVGEMAQKAGLNVAVGGNFGTPALDLLTTPEPDLYVLELSSFQLETTYSLHAAAAVVLNISHDHMDRYENLEEYAAAKMRIYDGCGVMVLGRESRVIRESPLREGTITFGMDVPKPNEFGIRDNHLAYGAESLLPIDVLRIKGRHQVENALAALALGLAVDLPMTSMLQALREFKGLSHRCQWVANINGVDWYNDSKGTNVGATQAAIVGLGDRPLVLIAGGQGKGADFTLLFDAVKQHVHTMIVIGEDANKIEAALKDACKILHADSMQQAVDMANNAAQKGDIVLLSPACASFDMFDNFEHRGDVFMELVYERNQT